MPSVCFYFQLHQPYRLRRYSVFDTDPHYFDELKNAEICRKVAHKCYLPASRLMLKLIESTGKKFKISYSITGVLLEQLEAYVPEAIEIFQQLAKTGCVEFLTESYYHSLASLYSEEEFREQVALHTLKIEKLFGQRPKVFRNTELVYSDAIGLIAHQLGYKVCLAEGVDQLLAGRSPDQVYHHPRARDLKILLKNYRLSDDIAFRFSNRSWQDWPLTADKFARWIAERPADACCNLFMDYETFGEHQWAETGIFDFLEHLPNALISSGSNFVTPSERADKSKPIDSFAVPNPTSWADTERDLSAWLGNAMQSNAAHELYKLESALRQSGDEDLLRDWRRLQSSDHFYYMCTKYFSDGDVHKYFSPYESPYDSYINFMNVLDNIHTRLGAVVE